MKFHHSKMEAARLNGIGYNFKLEGPPLRSKQKSQDVVKSCVVTVALGGRRAVAKTSPVVQKGITIKRMDM